MKKENNLFSDKGLVDHKSKLNKFNKKVSESVLDQVESGLTLEQLDIIGKKLPILKYHTQITIHGLFPDISNGIVYNYKSVFQNKNRSVGVRWIAIDEAKRQRIAEKIKHVGFRYHRNSVSTCFQMVVAYNERNKNQISDLKKIYDKIDTDLFYGKKNMYAASTMFGRFLVIDLYINAIYEKNIDAFVKKMGVTDELITEKINDKKLEDEKREAIWQADREKRNNIKSDAYKLIEKDVEILKAGYEHVKGVEPFECKMISVIYTYDDKWVFKVKNVYKEGKKRNLFNQSEQFNTLAEALAYKFPETSSYSDFHYSTRGRFSGYIIERY